jgi:hypothetical protein
MELNNGEQSPSHKAPVPTIGRPEERSRECAISMTRQSRPRESDLPWSRPALNRSDVLDERATGKECDGSGDAKSTSSRRRGEMLREDAPSPGKVSSLASQRRGHAPTPQWPTRARRRRLRSPPRSGYRGRDFLVRVDTDQRSSGQIDARIGRIFAVLRPTIKSPFGVS